MIEGITPITTKKLHNLGVAESLDKTAWLIYHEKKGEGKQATFKGNNGDIVTWSKDGNIVTVEEHVEKVQKQRPALAKRMYESKLDMGANIVGDKPKVNRKEFVGNGNIISWC